jgi:hypothetical protein
MLELFNQVPQMPQYRVSGLSKTGPIEPMYLFHLVPFILQRVFSPLCMVPGITLAMQPWGNPVHL